MAEQLVLDFPQVIAREFPEVFDASWAATTDVLGTLAGGEFSALARHSRGLADYDWRGYHECNVVRGARVARALGAGRGRRVLDFGSYFGNFSLTAAALGFRVDAIDSYAAYAPALDRSQALMREHGIAVLDFASAGFGLESLDAEGYDAVLCLGVIEHIPHSPKQMLEALDRVLKPGGLLVIDTPNLAYLYKREALAQGRSIFPPISDQYLTEPPFEGHHREYTTAEMRWMLEQLGHDTIALETFAFSVYASGVLTGEALAKYRQMESDPELRELILTTSRKPRR